MRRTLLTLLSIPLVLAGPAHAKDLVPRHGLWEVTTTSELLKLVPHIPQSQMQQLMDLARQHGMNLPDLQNGAATSRVCITPEMAERNVLPNIYDDQLGCSAQNGTRVGNSYRMDLVCAGPRVKGGGKAEATFSSPERFSGYSRFEGLVQGTPVNDEAELNGRWVGADCGAVKPVQ